MNNSAQISRKDVTQNKSTFSFFDNTKLEEKIKEL